MDSQRSPESGAQAALAELRERLARVVPELAALAARGLPAAVTPASGERYAVTGVGGSEGPARLLVATLRSLGLGARFVPLSAFALGEVAARPGERLCVFSQGLSPNARVALSCAPRFAGGVLFTSALASSPLLAGFVAGGGRVLTLGPAEETGTLLRVVGPPVAMLAAVLFAHEVAGAPVPARALAELPSDLEAAAAAARAAIAALPAFAREAAVGRVAFVTAGEEGERGLACGLAIKWLEGLGVDEPPTWDVLEIAHGPFHAFYTEPRLLVALGEGGALFDRLEAMLAPGRHALLRLPARGPLARLVVEAAVNELFLAAFERAPRDLRDWPSKGKDAPLYALDEALGGRQPG
jgi:creatinine amidohydrolase